MSDKLIQKSLIVSMVRRAYCDHSVWLTLATLALVVSLECRAASFAKVLEEDLDHDGRLERIDINSERTPALEIRNGEKLLWSGVPGSWKPWKLQIADVDGDGMLEIVVGVFKSTKFFPKPHNCLFIYGWSGGHAFPRWLGSSLGRPFTDFLFADLDHEMGSELIALETSLDGKMSIGIYRWNSFGFTLDRRSGDWHAAKLLGAKDGEILVEAEGKRINVSAKTGESYEK